MHQLGDPGVAVGAIESGVDGLGESVCRKQTQGRPVGVSAVVGRIGVAVQTILIGNRLGCQQDSGGEPKYQGGAKMQ
jgi:hypothetical protein